MVKDPEFIRRAKSISDYNSKLEGIHAGGGIGEGAYNERKGKISEKLSGLREDNFRVIDSEIGKQDMGLSELGDMLSDGLVSKEQYTSSLDKILKQKAKLESDRRFVESAGDGEYIDYLTKEVEEYERIAEILEKGREHKSFFSRIEFSKASNMMTTVLGIFIISILGGVIISELFISEGELKSDIIISLDKGVAMVVGRTGNDSEEKHTTTLVGSIYWLVEIGREYERAYDPVEVFGSVVYTASKDNKYFIVSDYGLIGGAYDRVGPVKVINESIAFVAYIGNRSYVVIDGTEMGGEYDQVYGLAQVGGSVAYVAENGSGVFVVLNDRVIGEGKGYEAIYNLTDVDGRLAFIAERGGRLVAVYDGKEIVGDYDTVVYDSFVDVGGKLAFTVGSGGRYYIIHDGKAVGRKHFSAVNPREIMGKLAYIAVGSEREFVVHGGKHVGGAYSEIIRGSVVEVDGKIAFVAMTPLLRPMQGSREYVVLDGKQFGGEHDTVFGDSLRIVYGKLAFLAVVEDRRYVVFDGKRVGMDYDSVGSLEVIQGSLAYVAKKGAEYVVVFKNYEIGEGMGYGRIRDLIDVGGKLAFSVEKDGREYVVVWTVPFESEAS